MIATVAKRSGAFTLIELMVSLAMFSIIALVLQSALLLASRAIPDAKSAVSNQISSSRAADRLTSELSYALTVTESTANAVTFTVADRNNDGTAETIRYSWSGVAGEPLMRQYNGGTASAVLDDVREFTLAFDKRSQKNPATYTEAGESLLYSFTGGLLNNTNSIDTDEWSGQYFVPSLPNNAVYWRITRVRYQAEKNSTDDGKTRVQIRTATAGGLPTTTVVDQSTLVENTMSGSWAWQDTYFTGAARLDPAAGACIVFRFAGGSDESCDVLAKTVSLALTSGAKLLTTSNYGSTWSANALSSMPMYVYGVSATQDPDTYSYFLMDVRVALRSGADAAGRVNTAAQVFSQPQVSGP